LLARHNRGITVTVESMSVDGARLAGPTTLDVGERVQVLFEIEGHPLEVHAEVVRVESRDMSNDRIAVRFVEIDDDTRDQIRRLVLRAIELEDQRLGKGYD
jgi:hypothetical protein